MANALLPRRSPATERTSRVCRLRIVIVTP
jgi:hypothetical protein